MNQRHGNLGPLTLGAGQSTPLLKHSLQNGWMPNETPTSSLDAKHAISSPRPERKTPVTSSATPVPTFGKSAANACHAASHFVEHGFGNHARRIFGQTNKKRPLFDENNRRLEGWPSGLEPPAS